MSDDVRRVRLTSSNRTIQCTTASVAKWLRTKWGDRYSGPPMASDELGRIAADEIERLRAEIGSRDARIEQLEKLERFNYEELRKLLMDDGKHIITRDQISMAWRRTEPGCIREETFASGALAALDDLGIVACEDCGGMGRLMEWHDGGKIGIDSSCPDCHGEGWVIETPNSASSRDTGVEMSPLDDKCRHNHTKCEDQRSIAIEDIYTDAETGREYATLHFYAGDPESMAQLQRCLNAERVLWAVQEFDQWLRICIKHTESQPSLDRVRRELYQCFTDRGLSVWEE